MAYFSKEKFIDMLNAKADMALGTPKQVFLSVAKMLEALPETDVVEVVRCKDCIYAEKHYDTTHLIGNTYYHSGAPTRLLYITCKNRKGKLEERDFCSYGKWNLSELPTD